MDTSKIIRGVVSSGRYTVTAPIVKEDYGLYLQIEGVELPPTYEVDFSNSENNGTSVTMIGNADGVLIPRQFIDSGKDVFAFLYHVGDNYGRTVFKFRIPNKVRPDRTNEQPTPEEQSVIDQAISALNEAVEQTAQDKADADASAQSASESAENASARATMAQNHADRAEQARDDAQTYANNASASASASAQSASEAQSASTNAETYALNSGNKAVESAQSASASANSASQAQGYANNASSSAQSASQSASGASASAQTASANAQDASQSATTASQKATESAQSASQALTYKTDAESAKTASQTAQGLAESARDSAISAKNDAESARDDAITAKEEAESIVDGISGALDDKADVITDTALGAIASFSDGADNLPLKSLIVDINPIQDLSHGDPSPENICPISGWTGMTVNASGKNIVDISRFATEYPNYCSFSNGVLTVTSNSALYSRGINVDIPQGSILNWTITNGTSVNARLRIVYEDGTVRSHSSPIPLTVSKRITALRFDWGTGGTFTVSNFQVELGSTATAYEPYTGRTIPINWQTEAGTVYGGKLDVLSGVLRVEKVTAIYDGTETYSNSYFPTVVCTKALPTGKGGGNTFLCSHLPTGTYYADFSSSTKRAIQFGHCDTVWNVASANELKAKIAEQYANGTPVTFVYELATPIEIQLDAHAVNSLYGQNNIFADTGECSVEYRADTKLYIERLTAPDSADMIADANITSGQYFMIGNSLYKATANIANGGQITVGTNCTRVSLAQALNEINA